MSILIFDLDDTLYPEITYVHSGFEAVWNWLADQFGFPRDYLFYCMIDILEQHGRGQVFDSLLNELGIYSKKTVKSCLNIYRNHEPKIELDLQAKRVLQGAKKNKMYLVTDGNKIVQHKKVCALKLSPVFDGIYITHRYGVQNAKPSTYCFDQILKKEKCSPSDAVYIGDNPRKDFINIKKMGLRTVRVMTGAHKDVELDKEHEAEFRIHSMKDLPQILKRIKFL